ncbi:hypothetical protein F4678DRAFT_467902 [Xylaria arbuscula]|nr:hypothetical protein F4678DRAFT_467902 [Xylaria arbuscula]
MPPPARVDSSKRRPSSGHIIPPSDTTQTQPLRRKQKLAHPTRPPPAFWDNLSEIPLTRSALQELDRRNAGTPSPSSASSTHYTATKSTGPYGRAFQQHLIDHGICPDGYEHPDGKTPPQPNDLDDILHVLAKPRSSLVTISLLGR